MADTYDLFRKLSSGANFDRHQYRKDIALIQVLELYVSLAMVDN